MSLLHWASGMWSGPRAFYGLRHFRKALTSSSVSLRCCGSADLRVGDLGESLPRMSLKYFCISMSFIIPVAMLPSSLMIEWKSSCLLRGLHDSI